MYSKDIAKKQIQEKYLAMLKDFDKLCRNNNIKYSVHGGTMLGAVREKGFIPWDDDVDICMLRSEYDKLKDVLKCEKVFIWLDNRQLISKEVAFSLDILVYDSISSSKVLQKFKKYVILFFEGLLRSEELHRTIGEGLHNKIEVLALKCLMIFGKLFNKEKKEKWCTKAYKNWFKGDGSLIHLSNDKANAKLLVRPQEWMKSYEDIQFENICVMISKNYHELLCSSYGENYMIPVKDELMIRNHQRSLQSRLNCGK